MNAQLNKLWMEIMEDVSKQAQVPFDILVHQICLPAYTDKSGKPYQQDENLIPVIQAAKQRLGSGVFNFLNACYKAELPIKQQLDALEPPPAVQPDNFDTIRVNNLIGTSMLEYDRQAVKRWQTAQMWKLSCCTHSKNRFHIIGQLTKEEDFGSVRTTNGQRTVWHCHVEARNEGKPVSMRITMWEDIAAYFYQEVTVGDFVEIHGYINTRQNQFTHKWYTSYPAIQALCLTPADPNTSDDWHYESVKAPNDPHREYRWPHYTYAKTPHDPFAGLTLTMEDF